MGYRDAEIKQHCHVCHELASARCPRCGHWLCGKHGVARWDLERCEECEARYVKAPEPWYLSWWGPLVALGLAGILIAPACVIGIFNTKLSAVVAGGISLLIVLAGSALGSVGAVVRRRRERQNRDAFLAERFDE